MCWFINLPWRLQGRATFIGALKRQRRLLSIYRMDEDVFFLAYYFHIYLVVWYILNAEKFDDYNISDLIL